MAQAYLNSVEALTAAKAALAAFIHECSRALGEAEADVLRHIDRLKHEDAKRWEREERTRADAVAQAKALIRKKELLSMQESPSVVDERKAVAAAQRRLAEAGEKRVLVRKGAAHLDKELALFKGQVQGLNDCLARALPRAMHALDRMATSVQKYAALGTDIPSIDAPPPANQPREAPDTSTGSPAAPTTPAEPAQ